MPCLLQDSNDLLHVQTKLRDRIADHVAIEMDDLEILEVLVKALAIIMLESDQSSLPKMVECVFPLLRRLEISFTLRSDVYEVLGNGSDCSEASSSLYGQECLTVGETFTDSENSSYG
jgi:hypothetical protein